MNREKYKNKNFLLNAIFDLYSNKSSIINHFLLVLEIEIVAIDQSVLKRNNEILTRFHCQSAVVIAANRNDMTKFVGFVL